MDFYGIVYRIAGSDSRGTCCLPAEHKRVKDGKDHFPVNSVSQARNALSRVMQYERVPKWFNGKLSTLRNIVKKRVHEEYPSINIEI
jgi:hypothetical protein